MRWCSPVGMSSRSKKPYRKMPSSPDAAIHLVMAWTPCCSGGPDRADRQPEGRSKGVHKNAHRSPEYTCVISPLNCFSQLWLKMYAAAKPSRTPPATPASYFSSFINLRNFLEPVTFVRSPTFTNKLSGVIIKGSNPDNTRFFLVSFSAILFILILSHFQNEIDLIFYVILCHCEELRGMKKSYLIALVMQFRRSSE